MKVKEIQEKEWKKTIDQKGKVLIDCYAPWCGPCRMLSPIIDDLSEEINNVTFYKINIDDAASVSEKYEIMSIPTLLLFENGNLKDTIVGFKSKEELEELLKKIGDKNE